MIKKLLFTVLILVQTVVFGATNTYTGSTTVGGNLLWSTAANWSLGVAPTATDDVVIPSGKTVVLDVTSVSANSITISGTLDLNKFADITINCQLIVVTSSNGHINFDHSIIRLPSNVTLYLQNGSGSLNGSCNNNDEIFVGTVQYAVCVGGGALYLFDQIESAGGINTVTSGAIGTAQSICIGDTPATLTTTTAAAGAGTITYEWQTNASGSYVTISGATGATYTPPALTSTTSYQRRTKSVIGGYTFYSAYTTSVKVTVNPLPTAGLTSNDADNTFCSGTSVTFTATGGTSYNFKVGGTSVQSGASATYTTTTLINGQVVTVDVTNALGCKATSSGITNTVNALPTAGLTSSDADNTFCSGTSVTFTATGGGTSYNFKVGGTSVQSGASATYTTTTLTNGQVVTVDVTNGSGCTATSSGIINTVNALPTITSVSAPAAICQGSSATVTLASITGTGSSYNLYTASSGGTLIGVIPQTISPTISTTYYVEAVSSAGCVSSIRKSVVITVNSLVDNTATGFSSSSFCVGNQATITFDANNGSGVFPYTLSYRDDTTNAIYTQSIPNDDSTTFNLIPNPTATTHYTLLSITDNNGCVNSSPKDNGAIATITSLPSAPTVGTITQPTCALATGSVVLSGLPSGNWTINPGGIAGSTSSTTVSGLAVGTYNFTVTNASGCTSPASANVVISPLITKTWNGSAWSPLGVPTNNNLVVINGNYNTTSNGDLNACSLVINSSYTLTITAGKNVIIQNDLTVNGVLEVLDQGSLVMVNDPGTVTNNGTTNIHRFTTPFKLFDYIYWSTPVVSTSIATTFLSKGWRTDHAYEYSPSGNWSFATTMTPGNGCVIMVPAPTTAPGGNVSEVVFSGKVNNGIQKITGVIPDSFYLLGNPYPSALDAEAFLDYNSGVLDGTLYFWTHNTAIQAANSSDTTLGSGGLAFTSNDYASYNSLGSVAVGLGETAGGVIAVSGGAKPTGKIASGQGFFASSNVTILGSNEIVFKNSMRLVGSTLGDGTGVNQQFFRTKSPKSKTVNAVEKSRIWLNLTNTQGAFKQTLVGYITGATNGYEGRFDGESFDGNEFVDFYSVNQDKNLVIQGRALPFDENDEVPLGFKSTISGDFTINIDQVDGSLINQAVYIEDKLTNTLTDLKKGNYTFATAAGIFNDRFVLKYSNKTLGTTKFDITANKVLVSINNKQIKINSFAETIDKVAIYDLLGKQIYQKNKVNSTEWSVSDLMSSHQTVIIKTTLENGATLTDKIVY